MRELPLLKRGSHLDLAFININETRISFKRTCAIDSAFQILLIAYSDYPFFAEQLERDLEKNKTVQQSNKKFKKNQRKKIKDNQREDDEVDQLDKDKSNDDMLNCLHEMVIETSKAKKITASVYKKRARIMLQYKKPVVDSHKQIELDCSCDIGDFLKVLYSTRASLKIEKSCPNQCIDFEEDIFETIFVNISFLRVKKALEGHLNNYLNTEEVCLDCRAPIEKVNHLGKSLPAFTNESISITHA